MKTYLFHNDGDLSPTKIDELMSGEVTYMTPVFKGYRYLYAMENSQILIYPLNLISSWESAPFLKKKSIRSKILALLLEDPSGTEFEEVLYFLMGHPEGLPKGVRLIRTALGL